MRDRLLALFDPNRSILLFVVGTATLTVGLTVLYDTVKDLLGLAGAWALALALIALSLAVIAWQARRARSANAVDISVDEQPSKRVGLIVLVSPHRATAPAAISYHLGTLRTCWLIASQDSLDVAKELQAEFAGQIEHIYFGSKYLVDPDEVEDTYDLVTRILENEAPAEGILARQIIADITGGLKPMTAGMALACLAKNRDMQYMKARRNEKGEPGRAVPSEPVRIDIELRQNHQAI